MLRSATFTLDDTSLLPYNSGRFSRSAYGSDDDVINIRTAGYLNAKRRFDELDLDRSLWLNNLQRDFDWKVRKEHWKVKKTFSFSRLIEMLSIQ